MPKKKKERFNPASILLPVVVVAAAFLFTAFLLLVIGKNPFLVYSALFQGAFGSFPAWVNTMNKAIPISFCAFAVCVSQKGGTFNIGVEGQLAFGAMGCTLAAVYLQGLPPLVHIPASILAGIAAGMLWSLIPALLFVKRGIDLLVIFLLMNNISHFILEYFVLDRFAGSNSLVPATESIQESSKLPLLVKRPNKLSIAVLIAVGVAAALYYYFYKTVAGYELQAVGLNKHASSTAGIDTKRQMFLSLVVGGALAGIGGSLEVLGNHHRLYTGFSPGYGYDGIPIAMLSGGNPFYILLGSLMFGALRSGSVNMRAMSGVSDEIVSVIQGLLILMVASQSFIRYLLGRKRRAKEALQ